MFMIPLAISSATSVRVGQLLGSGNTAKARLAGLSGIFCCGIFMMISALILMVFREGIVGIYTKDLSIQGIAVSLLLIAAIFQVVDGIQIGAAGALRGYKDTRIPMLINIFSYWALAFPLSYMAAITYRLPPNYIWIGFVIGLTIAAILLTTRFIFVSNRYQS
jgi:MATE family multidrug resistance protein